MKLEQLEAAAFAGLVISLTAWLVLRLLASVKKA